MGNNVIVAGDGSGLCDPKHGGVSLSQQIL